MRSSTNKSILFCAQLGSSSDRGKPAGSDRIITTRLALNLLAAIHKEIYRGILLESPSSYFVRKNVCLYYDLRMSLIHNALL